MKCKQKLCQRTKNIDKSGNCTVCDDVIREATKEMNDKKKNITEKVHVDLTIMKEAHDKLANGFVVDQNVLSNLILGGVINILHQHDTIEEIQKSVNTFDLENLSNRLRIESLENWVLRQSGDIEEVRENIVRLDKDGVIDEENQMIESLKRKVTNLEIDLNSLKTGRNQDKKLEYSRDCGWPRRP